MKSGPAGSRLFFVLPLLFLIQFAACDSHRIISGVYQSSESVQIQGIDGFEQARWIEMMLAQFGPDLTGIIRVYDDDQFMIPADGMCSCRYVTSGFISGGEITLSFMSHGDCPGGPDTPLVLGSFVFEESEPLLSDVDAGDTFTGYLKSQTSDTGDLSGNETAATGREITFNRVKLWDQVGESDLACDDPLAYGVDN